VSSFAVHLPFIFKKVAAYLFASPPSLPSFASNGGIHCFPMKNVPKQFANLYHYSINFVKIYILNLTSIFLVIPQLMQSPEFPYSGFPLAGMTRKHA